MKFIVGCKLGYKVEDAASFVLNIQPAELPRQKLGRESLIVTPELPLETYLMPESGNRYVRFQAGAGELLIEYEAEIELDPRRDDPATVAEIPVPELPFPTLPHLYPSRYCQADRLPRAAQSDFGHLPPGHGRVTAICNWIYEQIEYRRGTSDEHTSAADTLIDRAGVCRDFAHLMIAICRALSIPARFTTGIDYGADPALGPTDFHAYVEVFLSGRWYMFDPSGTAIPMGFVRIGTGRDAADVRVRQVRRVVERVVRRDAAVRDVQDRHGHAFPSAPSFGAIPDASRSSSAQDGSHSTRSSRAP